MGKLEQARKARGWSANRAGREAGLGARAAGVVLKAERAEEQDPPRLAHLEVRTAVRLLEVYPELDLEDFVPDTTLRLVCRPSR